MPAMRRGVTALVVVAALGLAGCAAAAPTAVEVAAAVPPAPAPAEAEGATTEAESEPTDDAARRQGYWSKERLAALEAAKEDYVPPTPAPAPDPADDPAEQTDGPVTAAGESVPAGSYRLEGQVDVPDQVWLREYSDEEPVDGDACRRDQKGYEDVEPGAQVTVRDGGGVTLATGVLEEGRLATSYEDKVGKAMDCRLPFTVVGLPASMTYAIEVGQHADLAIGYEELQRQAWKVAFSLDW